jgi:hypothetical protein
MARIYRSFMEVCWLLGVVCMVMAVVMKFVPYIASRVSTDSRGMLIFAGVLFLCSVATRAVGRTGVPAGQ